MVGAGELELLVVVKRERTGISRAAPIEVVLGSPNETYRSAMG